MSWYVDDVQHMDASAEGTPPYSADFIDATEVALGTVWTCEADVSDGEASSTGSDSIDTTTVSE